jgi:hypothetical protein
MGDFGVTQWDNKPSDIPTEQGVLFGEERSDVPPHCMSYFLSQ